MNKNNMKYILFLILKIKIISHLNIFNLKNEIFLCLNSWLNYLNFTNNFFILCYSFHKLNMNIMHEMIIDTSEVQTL